MCRPLDLQRCQRAPCSSRQCLRLQVRRRLWRRLQPFHWSSRVETAKSQRCDRRDKQTPSNPSCRHQGIRPRALTIFVLSTLNDLSGFLNDLAFVGTCCHQNPLDMHLVFNFPLSNCKAFATNGPSWAFVGLFAASQVVDSAVIDVLFVPQPAKRFSSRHGSRSMCCNAVDAIVPDTAHCREDGRRVNRLRAAAFLPDSASVKRESTACSTNSGSKVPLRRMIPL